MFETRVEKGKRQHFQTPTPTLTTSLRLSPAAPAGKEHGVGGESGLTGLPSCRSKSRSSSVSVSGSNGETSDDGDDDDDDDEQDVVVVVCFPPPPLPLLPPTPKSNTSFTDTAVRRTPSVPPATARFITMPCPSARAGVLPFLLSLMPMPLPLAGRDDAAGGAHRRCESLLLLPLPLLLLLLLLALGMGMGNGSGSGSESESVSGSGSERRGERKGEREDAVPAPWRSSSWWSWAIPKREAAAFSRSTEILVCSAPETWPGGLVSESNVWE